MSVSVVGSRKKTIGKALVGVSRRLGRGISARGIVGMATGAATSADSCEDAMGAARESVCVAAYASLSFLLALLASVIMFRTIPTTGSLDQLGKTFVVILFFLASFSFPVLALGYLSYQATQKNI